MTNGSSERWNPREPLDITPAQYEKQVTAWLRSVGADLQSLSVAHQERVSGSGGEYALDGRVEFQVLGGAKVSVVVECKKHKRAVDRDTILTVHAKMQALGFHKAMVFSTSGFQSGAIEFATDKGIALVIFVDGKATYQTRSSEPILRQALPSWLPEFAAQMISGSDHIFHVSSVFEGRAEPIQNWLHSTGASDTATD